MHILEIDYCIPSLQSAIHSVLDFIKIKVNLEEWDI